MKTYLINLDRSPDRLEFMRRQFEKMNLCFERFSAIDGRRLLPDDRRRGFSSARSLIASKKRLSEAEIAVAMSHVGVYRRMVEDNIPYALVLEDDVVLGAGFAETLSRVESFLLPGQAQLVVLSGYGIANAENLPVEIRSEESIWCADAYCLTLEAAKLILVANDPVITVADSFKRWRKWYGLKLYRSLPASVRQDDVTFKSENLVLPKSNWLVRNLLWVADWVLTMIDGRRRRCFR